MRGLSSIVAVGVLLAGSPAGLQAQKQFDLFAKVVDGSGNAPATLEAASVRVTEDGQDAKVLKAEPVDWPTKVQILLDNGVGMGAESLTILRNGLRGLIEKLPEGADITVVTTAPQPRFLVRPTTDRAAALAGVDRLAPDSGSGRFIESLSEATQRIERDKSNHFPIIIAVATTAGDTNVRERDVESTFRRLEQRPTLVHVVMLTSSARSAGAGVNQTEVGLAVTKYTGGRYENLATVSRIATLLPELGEELAKKYGAGTQRGLFKLTVERPAGKSGPLGRISMSTTGGIVTTSISLDGRMR